MATSPSPHLSPVMGGAHRIDRQHSNSPPQQLSKRDKRRTMLAERLQEITASFSQNRDFHYREQLQAIQIDMNLIMEADPYGDRPIPDSREDIDALVMANIQKGIMKSVGPNPPPRAGRMFANFVRDVNDLIEERDAQLTMHRRNYDVKLSELAATDAYRRKLAHNEHSSLAGTLRDRLLNSVNSKKNRLAKDKDMLEITENNALLLHPRQFGITDPTSPGGIHVKRATRYRRDVDELPTFVESNKRKRKAADSDESPGPIRPRLDNGSSTPRIWREEKERLHAIQVGTPLYSIDKLFTEKELAMTYNNAAYAAHSYIQRHDGLSSDDANSPSNGKSDSSSENEKGPGAAADNDDEADSPPSGVAMERQVSHATRSTRGGMTLNYMTATGIEGISDLNYPGNMEALMNQMPKMPPVLAGIMQRPYTKGEGSNYPTALSSDDAAADLDMIRRARSYNNQNGSGRNLELETGGRTLLEIVSQPKNQSQYNYWINAQSHDNSNASGGKEDFGGVPMSKQSSRGAESEIGGTPMSRQATGEGVTSSRGRKIKPRGTDQ